VREIIVVDREWRELMADEKEGYKKGKVVWMS